MTDEGSGVDRRRFLSSCLMWGGLAAGYGLGAYHFLRYLVPMGEDIKYRELFVGPVDQLKVGESRTVKTPSGETFVMARTGKEAFRVLSDVCPHLGCRVHWIPPKPGTKDEEGHFFCPCHDGKFNKEGLATAGPPAEAGQSLARLETVIRGNSVFVLIKES